MKKGRIRIFISQPMNGKSQSEIEFERDCIIDKIQKYNYNGKNVEFIYSVIKPVELSLAELNDNNDIVCKKPVWYLSKSIELISTADIVVFGKDWGTARGCRIEHEICEKYGIEILYY